MRIRRVKYRNFCQHTDTEVHFADGLTALMGPNGAGKTNLLNGLVWCLTGVDRNAGVKKDNVNLLAHPKDKASVTAFLEHGDVELEVFRSLRDEGQYLKVNGGRAITKDKELRAELQKILGVPERVLLDYVFVQQRKVFDFLEADPEAVSKVFGQLFGTERAAELYRLLGEVRIPPPASRVDSDVIAARLEDTRRQLQEVLRDIVAAEQLPEDWSETTAPQTVVIRTYETKLALQREIAELTGRMQEIETERNRCHQAWADSTLECAALEALAAQRRAEMESVKTELAAWGPYSQAAQRRDELQKTLDEIEGRLVAIYLPARPEGYIEASSQEREDLDALHREAVELKAFLKKWSETGRAACPECGTPTDQIVHRVPIAEERLRTIVPVVEDGVKRWKASEAHRKALTEVNRVRDTLLARRQMVTEQLAGLVVPPQPARAEHVLTAFVHDQAEFEKKLQTFYRQHDHLRHQAAALDSRLLDVAGWKHAKVEQEARLEGNELAYHSALQVLTRDRELARRRDLARAQKVLLDRRLTDDEADMERWKATHQKEERVERLRSHLEEVREVFHRDNLVKEVVEGYLGSMRDRVNELLCGFDASFRVHDFVDWKFKVRKASGRIHSALRLSDGEKVLFALAFRVIVNAMFAKELGLLCLDEPTSGLDETNMACLDVALWRLRELSRSRGLQVILVTHDRDVNLFDRVCRLAAPR